MQLHSNSSGLGAQAAAFGGGGAAGIDGEKGVFRMWKEVLDTIIRHTERFSGTVFQDWQFQFETVVRGCAPRLGAFLKWARRCGSPVDAEADIQEECRVPNAHLCDVLAQKSEG